MGHGRKFLTWVAPLEDGRVTSHRDIFKADSFSCETFASAGPPVPQAVHFVPPAATPP